MIGTSEILGMALSFAAGVGLGAIFFGGLWLTVNKGVSSAWSGFWFLSSLLLRMTIVLVGFYLLGAHHRDRMLPCFLGLILARVIVTRFVKGKGKVHAHHSR